MSHELLLPRSTPVSQGISPSAILAFVDAVEEGGHELHSLMISRHGQVVAEGWWTPYRADAPHMLFSLSKSFTSTAAGFAVTERMLSVDDKVLSFFPDKAPNVVSENLAAMRVRDLLTMTTGTQDTMGILRNSDSADWVRAILAAPVEHIPGTFFAYNSGATYLVSAIVQKLTGQKIIDYLEPRLFAPLGITDKRWEECPLGVNTGGWGLYINTESIAKFGQLYLDKGMFGGKRIIPEAWIDEATSRQVSNGDDPNNDWSQGYGYQFWRCRHGVYRGDGAFGQYCVVMPEQDMVVATTAALKDMGAVLSLMWDHLLPACSQAPLPADDSAQSALEARLESLGLPGPIGAAVSPTESSVFGKTYRFPANDQTIDSVRFEAAGDEIRLTLVAEGATHAIVAGRDRWVEGETSLTLRIQKPFTVFSTYRIGASAAWGGETLTIQIAYIEMPFTFNAVFRFSGSEVALDIAPNVTFQPTDRPTLVGAEGA